MDKSLSTTGSDEKILTMPARFANHVAVEEHVALLENSDNFDLLRRKGDLLDEGVAAVFGLADAGAKLLALCFHASKFTPAEATEWLAGRSFAPLIFVPNSGRD